MLESQNGGLLGAFVQLWNRNAETCVRGKMACTARTDAHMRIVYWNDQTISTGPWRASVWHWTQPPPRPRAIALSPPTAAAAAAAALRNETQSHQTISKDNAFIKTYSSSSTTPEARVHQQRSSAELSGSLKSTNDGLVAVANTLWYCVCWWGVLNVLQDCLGPWPSRGVRG